MAGLAGGAAAAPGALAATAQPAVLTTFGNPHNMASPNVPTGPPPGTAAVTLTAIDNGSTNGSQGPPIPHIVTGTAATTPAIDGTGSSGGSSPVPPAVTGSTGAVTVGGLRRRQPGAVPPHLLGGRRG